MTTWEQAQCNEAQWHGNCVNSYGEETKQLEYALRMGLTLSPHHKAPSYNLTNRSVLDMGAGPYSLLLKAVNVKGTAVDPMPVPHWVIERYEAAGIEYICEKGENYRPDRVFDEGWLYNVLQHTEDPKAVVDNLMALCKVVRVHEWIDVPKDGAHIHTLTEKGLQEWFGAEGNTGVSGRDGTHCWFGVFFGGAK